MYLKIIIVVILSLTFVSCQKVEVVMVDNTTDRDMKVKFEEGMSLTVPANTVRRMTMKAQPTNVYINDTLVQTVDPSKDKYNINLINPSLGTYYIEQIFYGSDRSSRGDTPINFIKVDEYTYPGRVRVIFLLQRDH